MKITHQDLYDYLQATSMDCNKRDDYVNGYDGKISQEAWDFLQANKDKLEFICVSWAMSENHIGGDDMVELASNVVEAIKEGWEVVTWYGPDTEVLVAGVKGIEITD